MSLIYRSLATVLHPDALDPTDTQFRARSRTDLRHFRSSHSDDSIWRTTATRVSRRAGLSAAMVDLLVYRAMQAPAAIPALREITVSAIARGLEKGDFTGTDLVEAYERRNNEIDADFHSMIQWNPDARIIAAQLDDERIKHGRRSPLHGVPIVLKDNIVTLDSMEATAGSVALLGAKPHREATIAVRLREAGAVILGKAALTEWANYRWTNASTGWSARGGQCTGPFYPLMKASGSSTGSAVSPSLGLSFAGIGTETDGSIVNPAGKAAMVGIKPTVGLVPRDGVIPVSSKQDSVGPIARTVVDAAHILTAIAGKSEDDPATHGLPFTAVPDYAASCCGSTLEGVRIGVPRSTFAKVGQVEMAAFERALTVLKNAGAELVDQVEVVDIQKYGTFSAVQRRMTVQADFRESLEAYLGKLATNPQNIRTMSDLCNFTKICADEGFPARNIAQFEAARDVDVKSNAFLKIQEFEKILASADGGIRGTLKKHQLDMLVAPTPIDVLVTFAAISGLPVISLPLGVYPKSHPVHKDTEGRLITEAPGIPFPLCLFGDRYTEEHLLKAAFVLEQSNTADRSIPYRLPTTDLVDIVNAKRERAKI